MKALIIALVVLASLLVWPMIAGNLEYGRLKAEISRVGDKTGITPSSVECRNVEFASICYAEYSGLSSSDAKQMLTSSGYSLAGQQYSRENNVSATNQSVSVRVDSNYYSDSSDSSSLTLKFKNIRVTL